MEEDADASYQSLSPPLFSSASLMRDGASVEHTGIELAPLGDPTESHRPSSSSESWNTTESGSSCGSFHLHQTKSIKQKLQKRATLPRVVIALGALVITILGVSFLREEDFKHPKVVYGTTNQEDCALECEATLYAICTSVDFEVHHTTKRLKNYAGFTKFSKEAQNVALLNTTACKFPIFPDPWIPYTVITITMLSIVLMVEGIPADVVLMCASIIFGATGILRPDTLWAGLAGEAVTTIGMLMVVGAAITDTGWLDLVMAKILGNSPIMVIGLTRMLFASLFMSMFFSNVSLWLLMSPALISWGRRLNFPKKKILAPFGITLQAGGQCTLLGSTVSMVAKSLYPSHVYDMTMFELFPIGGMIASSMIIASVICLPLLPVQSELKAALLPDLEFVAVLSDAEDRRTSLMVEGPESPPYTIEMLVQTGSVYDGAEIQETCIQLGRIPGVKYVRVGAHSHLSREMLRAGSRLKCHCSVEGVVNLRKSRGLQLSNIDSLLLLGTHRRRRHLYEAVVSNNSILIGRPVDPETFLLEYCSAVLAIRERKHLDGDIKAGDVLLLEAEDSAVSSTLAWSRSFSLTRLVPDSSPPRQGTGPTDVLRSVFVFVSFAGMVAAVSTNQLSTSIGSASVVVLFLIFKVLSVQEVFDAIRGRALLIIVGSAGLAQAMFRSGVCHFLGRKIVAFALPYGHNFMRASIYTLAALIGTLVHKPCSIAIVGPMLPSLAVESGMSIRSMIWAGIFGAGACFVTPFGDTCSIFIMKDGEYTYGEFAKYGLAMQLCHAILSVTFIGIFCG